MSNALVIRNRNGNFVNTNLFREDARTFQRNGVYIIEPENSIFWLDYWKKRRERSLKGYEIAGTKITGDHYFYLNFTRIERVPEEALRKIQKSKRRKKQTIKVYDFPDFWDGDYTYYWSRELAKYDILDIFNEPEMEDEEKMLKRKKELFNQLGLKVKINPKYLTGGRNIIVGKGRRRGFAQPLDEIVMTKDGYKTMGEVQVGDLLVGEGGFVKVTEIHEQMSDTVLEILMSSGRSIKVSGDHLVEVYDRKEKYSFVIPTFWLRRLIFKYPRRFSLPLIEKDVPHSEKDLKVDFKQLRRFLWENVATPDFIKTLEEEGFLNEKGHFDIPHKYLYASPKQRHELLDVFFDKNSSVIYEYPNVCTVKSFHKLVYSLAKKRIRVFKQRSNGTVVFILHDDMDYETIASVIYVDHTVPTKCVTVDSERHLYAGDDYILTHNSHKSSGSALKNFALIPRKKTYLAAYLADYLYPTGLFQLVYDKYMFLQENTPWNHPMDAVNQPNKGNIRASYYAFVNGRKTEKGFMSEIASVSFNTNTDVLRGKDAYEVYIEEAGAAGSPGKLKQFYKSIMDTAKAGGFKTGFITVFGTSGNLESSSHDYASMFFKPDVWDFLPFQNVWDDGPYKDKEVGFFFPASWNMEGFYDEWGNSNEEKAKEFILKEREDMRNKGASEVDIILRQQENPLSPSEAFKVAKSGIFNVVDLPGQLMKVEAENLQMKIGMPVDLYFDGEGNVKSRALLNYGELSIIDDIYDLPKDTTGSLIVYEPPDPLAKPGTYYIGYDPVREIENGTSFASFLVYKSGLVSHHDKDKIVAEYIGRRSEEEVDELIMKTAIWYGNSKIMHENMVVGVRTFFKRKNKLYLLARQPDGVISKHIQSSKVRRIFGTHMTPELKAAGERYIKEWLKSVVDYDENGDPVLAYQKIYSPRLLKELIFYTREGNFDEISALMMIMFQREENLIYLQKDDSNSSDKFIEKFKEAL